MRTGEQLRAIFALKRILILRSFSRSVVASRLLMLSLYAGGVGLSALIGILMVTAGKNVGDDGIAILVISHIMIYVFCLFWLLGLFLELQRSDVVDMRHMLHLPVSLRMVFLLNVLFALITPALFFFFFPVLGWIVGLSIHQSRMVLGIPLALAFFLALGAWTYYFRGMLAILMENKRSRQLILGLLPVALVLFGQLPNLMNSVGMEWTQEQVIERPAEGPEGEPQEETTVTVLSPAGQWVSVALPLGWMPYGLYALHEGRGGLWALCLGGLLALAAAGLALGYRSTYRHYQGYGSRRVQARSSRPASAASTHRHRPLRIPLAPDSVSAVAAVVFQTLIRHPSLRINLAMPFVIGVVFLLTLFRGAFDEEPLMGGALITLGFLMWPIMGYAYLLFNVFGLDPGGFRSLMLTPVPRRHVFLGANLAVAPFLIGSAYVFLVAGYFLAHIRPSIVAAAALLVFALWLSMSMAGNAMSILMPYALPLDGMKSIRSNPRMQLTGLVAFALTLFLAGICFCCLALDWVVWLVFGYQGMPFGVGAAALFVGITGGLYVATLPHVGRLLEEREQTILDTLTRERT